MKHLFNVTDRRIHMCMYVCERVHVCVCFWKNVGWMETAWVPLIHKSGYNAIAIVPCRPLIKKLEFNPITALAVFLRQGTWLNNSWISVYSPKSKREWKKNKILNKNGGGVGTHCTDKLMDTPMSSLCSIRFLFILIGWKIQRGAHDTTLCRVLA